jgi:hypothetical protein
MGFLNVGTINYHGTIQTIFVSSDPCSDPGFAEQSWEMTKSRYFKDYTGPPPEGLSKYSKKVANDKRRDLF